MPGANQKNSGRTSVGPLNQLGGDRLGIVAANDQLIEVRTLKPNQYPPGRVMVDDREGLGRLVGEGSDRHRAGDPSANLETVNSPDSVVEDFDGVDRAPGYPHLTVNGLDLLDRSQPYDQLVTVDQQIRHRTSLGFRLTESAIYPWLKASSGCLQL